MPRLAVALFICLAVPAVALADPPLTAEAFDALTLDKTMDTSARAGVYGVESFFSGHRVIWRDDSRCVHGTWEPVGDQICFTYEDQADTPICWTYHDRGGWIMGWLDGDRTNAPIMLTPTSGPISCEGFVGA